MEGAHAWASVGQQGLVMKKLLGGRWMTRSAHTANRLYTSPQVDDLGRKPLSPLACVQGAMGGAGSGYDDMRGQLRTTAAAWPLLLLDSTLPHVSWPGSVSRCLYRLSLNLHVQYLM